MADKKVSQLTALTGANAASGDLLYIVDVSEPVAADQSKKITLTEFQSAPVSAGTANGVAFLNASKVLTTGSALTFDGTKLGVGVASPGYTVQVKSSDASVAVNSSDDTSILRLNAQSGLAILETVTNTDLRFRINSSEQMRLTSTGLGIGTGSPSAKLDVANGNVFITQDYEVQWKAGAVTRAAIRGTSGDNLSFYTRVGGVVTETMRLDASGNLGLGVTPSAWSGYKAFQFAVGSGFVASSDSAYRFFAGTNAFYNGTNWIYKASTFASLYEQVDSVHKWFTAPSGTAGNAISFTQAMTLDANGNLGIGETTLYNKLAVTGNNPVVTIANNKTSVAGDIARLTLNPSGAFYNGSFYDKGPSVDGLLESAVTFASALRFSTYNGSNNVESGRFSSDGTFRVKGAGTAGSTDAVQFSGSAPASSLLLTSVGNFKIGGTADRATTEGTNQLVLFNGTAPVGTLTNGVSFYSASGEARVMDAAGNSTLLSPHDQTTNEWIFHSKHTPTGKVLRIDVERLLKFVNDHFGLDAVHEFIEE